MRSKILRSLLLGVITLSLCVSSSCSYADQLEENTYFKNLYIDGTKLSFDGNTAHYLDGTGAWDAISGGEYVANSYVVRPADDGSASGYSNSAYSINTRAYFVAVFLPYKMTVSQMVIMTGGTITQSGTFQIGVYSEDGQTRYINVTTPTLSVTSTFYAITVNPAVALNPGVYYIGFIPKGTASLQLKAKANSSLGNSSLNNKRLGEGYVDGMTAGTLPANFNPVTMTYSSQNTLYMRFDQ